LTLLDRLSRQQKALQDATRSVNETEQVGIGIIQSLDENKSKITGAQAKVCLSVPSLSRSIEPSLSSQASILQNEVDRADEILQSIKDSNKCIVM
jgi:hypothetical protein